MLKKFEKEQTFLADFHIHSNFSDGKHSISEIVDFYGSRGFGSIAITDHLCEEKTLLGKGAAYLKHTITRKNFSQYMDTIHKESIRAQNKYGMLVIPGFEVTKNSLSNHRSAHILGLNVSEYVAADDDVTVIIENLKKQNAFTVAAHPLSNGKLEKQTLHLWNRREELAQHFDAWEVGYQKYWLQEVADSGYRMVANTDLHHFGQIDGWKTVFNCDQSILEIFNSIRNGNCDFEFYRSEKQVDRVPKRRYFSQSAPISA